MNRVTIFLLSGLIALLAFPGIAQGQAAASAEAEQSPNHWPRVIETVKGDIVIYQPQVETLEGNVLTSRAAVSVEVTDKPPQFGVIWFDSRLETDRSERTAMIVDVDVTDVRFPVEDPAKVKEFSDLLEAEIPKWELPIDLDALIATLELADVQARTSQRINTEPPVIIFSEEPAVLITIDGEPRLVDTEESGIQRVMNTPFTLLLDEQQKAYYLFADIDSWYKAFSIKGDWQQVGNVPAGIAALAPEPEPEEEADDEETDPDEAADVGPPPKIIVATEPTELISSTGKPEYASIDGTSLLYVSNTESDVLMNTLSQEHFVLLSGRWFVSPSLDGPWRYMPVDEIPEEFEKIPEDSDMGTVLYAVPGTEVAREAVMDAEVPQTAAIEKSKASLNVEYDGEPKFEPITGTEMGWAANTATPVIQVNQRYYAVDEAVWFSAGSPQGPWALALTVPDVIYTIPADSPVYNVTFVRIYGETEEEVYVGYTPGYTNTYVYNTTVVYGTGYYWPGWYGSYYYPRYSTWGFHARWNPWMGFHLGFSYATGPFTFYIGRGAWFRGGWWGPARYVGYRRGFRRGYRRGYRRGARAGYRAGSRNAGRNNMYNSNRNKGRASSNSLASRNNAARSGTAGNRAGTGATAGNRAGSGAATGNRAQAGAAAGGRANNVYSDKSGNVHRKTDGGWEQRSGDSWKSSRDSAGSSAAQQRNQPSTQQRSQPSTQQRSSSSSDYLNRSSSARQTGSQRSSSYRSSRSGGAMRGGGGRRR